MILSVGFVDFAHAGFILVIKKCTWSKDSFFFYRFGKFHGSNWSLLLGFSFEIALGEGLSPNSLRMYFPELSVPRFCCSSFISGEINLFRISLFHMLDFWLLTLSQIQHGLSVVTESLCFFLYYYHQSVSIMLRSYLTKQV